MKKNHCNCLGLLLLAQKQGVLKQLQGKNRGKKAILAQKQRVPKQLQY